MGLSKVVATAGKVVFLHQLDEKKQPYAEDVTIEAQPGVPLSRVDWANLDGQVGVISWVFTPSNGRPGGLWFPDEVEPTS